MSLDSAVCTHRVLEGPIQEFVLKESSRRASDEMFSVLETLHLEAVKSQKEDFRTFLLVDTGIDFQPLSYTFQRMQSLVKTYPAMKLATVALIAPSGPLLRTISVFTRAIAPVRFFKPTEREAALTWLRGCIDAQSKR